MEDKSLQSAATLDNFSLFDYNDERISQGVKAYQFGKSSEIISEVSVSELDKVIGSWYESNDLTPFKALFLNDKIISQEDFNSFYGENDFDRKCEYCDIKESEINELIERGLIQTKRLGTRGKTMEVDRLEPNKGYVSGNIVTCCYWCNNAKTDEFSAKEFKPIGELMGQTLRKRLEK